MKLYRTSEATREMVTQFSTFPYDCRIVCRDGDVKAHRVILATASPFFQALLKDGPRLLVMPQYDRQTLKAIMKLVYYGETEADLTVMNCARELRLH